MDRRAAALRRSYRLCCLAASVQHFHPGLYLPAYRCGSDRNRGFAAWSLSHWLEGRALPRTARKVCAYVGFWLFALSTLTGLVVTWQAAFGRYVSHFWHLVHLWTGVLALPFLAYHLWPSAASGELPAQDVAPQDRAAFRRRTWTIAGLVTVVLFAGSAGLCVYYEALQRRRIQPVPAWHIGFSSKLGEHRE